jgi:cytochrome P450
MTEQPNPAGPSAGVIPAHIPPELVKPFDIFGEPETARCPFAVSERLHREGRRIFWTPINRQFGGAWFLTQAQDIRHVLGHPELFSSKGAAGFSRLLGETWDLIPLELDPPAHTKFRTLLNRMMSPSVVASMAPGITVRAVELLDAFRNQGSCEFMDAFGRPFPVSIFMQLMGLPAEQTSTFLQWESQLLQSNDFPAMIAAATAIRDYLRDLARQRRANPTDDLTSFVVTSRIDDRLLTDTEVMGVLYLLFVGGLDTVASSLGFFFRYLAEQPGQQQRLRENPALIDRAVEELLRRFSVVTTPRQCTSDLEIGGVKMKAGDWIMVNDSMANLDAEAFSAPLEVDFERKNNRHLAFSFGPHFCLGSHLARRELQTALREWLARVPLFRIKENEPVSVHGGGVFGVDRLVLEW